MTDKKYDLIITGAGPGGMTAGLYAGRYMLNTLILGMLPGGMITETHKMCNFPTYEEISGTEFAQKLFKQVQNLGVGISPEQVGDVEKQSNGEFNIKTSSNEYLAKKVIISTGTEKNKLNVPGEKEFLGKGISYCATCDAAFYKDLAVGVIGGGDAALSSAILLSEYAKKVYVIYRRDKFRKANASWIKQAEEKENIEFIFNAVPKKIHGNEGVESLELEDGRNIDLGGIFVEIGATPEQKLSQELGLETTEKGFIKVNKNQETNVKGVYAAGDITDNPLKQVVTAAGQGAVAAHLAYESINKEKTTPGEGENKEE